MQITRVDLADTDQTSVGAAPVIEQVHATLTGDEITLIGVILGNLSSSTLEDTLGGTMPFERAEAALHTAHGALHNLQRMFVLP